LGDMVDLVILEVLEMQAGADSEEALVVEAVPVEAALELVVALAAEVVAAVVPVGEEDSILILPIKPNHE